MKHRVERSDEPSQERISIIVPVLNEAARIERCLRAVIAQSPEVGEILIVDGGSTDGTQAIVERWSDRDSRLRWLDASPVDPRWTGKAWGLHFGLQHSDPRNLWVLTLDADVEPAPLLARSLLVHAGRHRVAAFSLATQQLTADWLDALIHPAMLTTLVYRHGAPGNATKDLHQVQANGQCFIAQRGILLSSQAFAAAQSSLCEDITIVRRLAECGEAVGFYESDDLITVRMYQSWRDTWNNWPRSLPMRDQYFGWQEAVGLLKVLGFQALPLPVAMLAVTLGWPTWILAPAMVLLAIRIGILFGVARAYTARRPSYWLSPLADLPVALRIIQFALRRRHWWRGRIYWRQRDGRFVSAANSD